MVVVGVNGWMDGTTRVCTPHSAAPLSAFLLGYGLGGLSSDLIARRQGSFLCTTVLVCVFLCHRMIIAYQDAPCEIVTPKSISELWSNNSFF